MKISFFNSRIYFFLIQWEMKCVREKKDLHSMCHCAKFSHVFQSTSPIGISTFNLEVKNSSSKYLEKFNYTVTHTYAIFPEREYHNTVTNC